MDSRCQNPNKGGLNMIELKSILNKFDRLMLAVTFAEAGDQQTALNIMNQRPWRKRHKRPSSRKRRRAEDRPALGAQM